MNKGREIELERSPLCNYHQSSIQTCIEHKQETKVIPANGDIYPLSKRIANQWRYLAAESTYPSLRSDLQLQY